MVKINCCLSLFLIRILYLNGNDTHTEAKPSYRLWCGSLSQGAGMANVMVYTGYNILYDFSRGWFLGAIPKVWF